MAAPQTLVSSSLVAVSPLPTAKGREVAAGRSRRGDCRQTSTMSNVPYDGGSTPGGLALCERRKGLSPPATLSSKAIPEVEAAGKRIPRSRRSRNVPPEYTRAGPATRRGANVDAPRLHPGDQGRRGDKAGKSHGDEPKAIRPATTPFRLSAPREDAQAYGVVAEGGGALVVAESVRQTWRSSSDSTGHAASSSSMSVVDVTVISLSGGSSAWFTRRAVYHRGASPKRAGQPVTGAAYPLCEPGALPRRVLREECPAKLRQSLGAIEQHLEDPLPVVDRKRYEISALGVRVEDLGGGIDRAIVRQDLRELDDEIVSDRDAGEQHCYEPTATEAAG